MLSQELRVDELVNLSDKALYYSKENARKMATSIDPDNNFNVIELI